MSPFEPPPPHDMHAWPPADTAAYVAFIAALQEVVERNVVITEEISTEMFTHITYLGTDRTTRNQQEAPAFCDRSRESGFTEILLGLPEHLPQAVVGGCRKAWKCFISQYSEESENDEAVLADDSHNSS
jgi:hypothetical protein